MKAVTSCFLRDLAFMLQIGAYLLPSRMMYSLSVQTGFLQVRNSPRNSRWEGSSFSKPNILVPDPVALCSRLLVQRLATCLRAPES